MIYLDSAYIAKFYLTEPDSPLVKLLAETEGRVCCSSIGRIEVAQVFHRKLREGQIDEDEAGALFEQLDVDCALGLWMWLPLTEELVIEAAAAFRRLPPGRALRTADAVHLGTARRHGFRRIYTSDRQMLAAAGDFELEGKSV
jgi:predicted nucleic acid-binding protein